MRLRNRVKELLDELGWTPSRLCNNTGIGRQTAYRLKKDPYYIGDGRALNRISDHLGIPIYDLIAIETQPQDRKRMLSDPTVKEAVERLRLDIKAKDNNCITLYCCLKEAG